MLTHISLFAGIGGDTLAAEWAGFKTVLFCEIDSFCQQVLRKHWPDVPIIGDVHEVTRETVKRIMAYAMRQRCRQSTSAICSGRLSSADDCRPTLLTAGIPCQPASVAGRRGGTADDRWLWPEAIRVLGELQPAWAVFENPCGIVSLVESGEKAHLAEGLSSEVGEIINSAVLDGLLAQIEEVGYEVQPICVPATSVGAWHRRDRVFIVAYAYGKGLEVGGESKLSGQCQTVERGGKVVADATGQQFDGVGIARRRRPESPDGSKAIPDSAGGCEQSSSPQRHVRGLQDETVRRIWDSDHGPVESCLGNVVHGIPPWVAGYWEREPDGVPRIATGLPNRVNKIRALGNAIVPQQIYPILKAIAEIEQ